MIQGKARHSAKAPRRNRDVKLAADLAPIDQRKKRQGEEKGGPNPCIEEKDVDWHGRRLTRQYEKPR
jgi:hypothetical protein